MRDMTKGKPFNHILRLSMPILICVIFGQSGLINSFAAGRFLGEDALSVVGNVSALTDIFMIFAYGMNVGGSVVVSHHCGAGRNDEKNLTICTLFIAGAGFAIVITVLGTLFSGAMLRAISTPAEIYSDSLEFLRVILLSLIFMYIFNIASGIFTALGDSLTPALYLIASNGINFALDIISVKYLDFGVTGLAWAGLISQAIAAAAVFFTLLHKRKQSVTAKTPVFTYKCFKHLIRNIIPAMLHSSVSAIGNVLIQGVINPMGTAVIAGCALGGKINGFASNCIDSIPDGNSAFAAQNIGGGNFRRVKDGFRAGLIIVLIISGIFSLSVILFHNQIIGFFVEKGTSEEAVKIASYYIITAACVYPLMGIKYLCDDILRAAGRMKLYLLTTVNNLVLRVALVYILAPKFGAAAIFISYTAALAITAIISIIIYRKGIWRKKIDNIHNLH
ncbi:MAG: polysaccharide biosynthesis C-terminal domain-containing protein [Ruminococcus sp.]|jgi:putative MATE family efflux protein|nr:polysaccharide biosynthesis C-terminal domain-containing protein [Ruminococcus sp.]